MVLNLFPRIINSGTEREGKAFDTPGYENALKNSGYTDEEARAYWNPRRDPLSQESLDDYVKSQIPKVSIENDNIVISAPKEVLELPFTAQLQNELKSLKGIDLSNPEVKNAIDKLNEEIQTNYSESLKEAIGWTQEEFEDYQRAIQATSVSNPMKSGDYLKWGPDGKPITDENGEIILKTPEEWVEYWKRNYTADERTDLFKKSLQSSNPYERTMALVMAGPGGTKAVYGYNPDEYLGQFTGAAASEMGRAPEGLFRLLNEDNNSKRVESYQKKLDVPVESLRNWQNRIVTDEQFETLKKNILGKTWSQLSDDEKAFIIEVGVSKENELERDVDRDLFKGLKGNPLDNMSSENENVSKNAIKSILNNSSFDRYKKVRDNYDTWQGYADWTQEDDERLASNAIWSGVSSNAGRIAGTIGRFLWENAVVKGLTGGISAKSLLDPKLATGTAAKELATRGFSMNRISDNIGAKVVTWITDKKIPLLSELSKNTLTFVGNLLGTIPEDILQTAVDNVVTYNADENKNLINPTQMSENFRNNLIIMTVFNALKAGWSSVKVARIAKQMEKAAELNAPLDVEGIVSDADDLNRAIRQGQNISVDGNEVSIVDADGNKKALNNITSEQGKIIRDAIENADANNNARLKDISEKLSAVAENNDINAQVDAIYRANEVAGLSGLDEKDVYKVRYEAGKIWKKLHNDGYEIVNPIGTKYREGVNMDVISIEGNKNADILYVTEVVKPAIYKDGKIVRPAQVVVSSENPGINRLDVFDKTPSGSDQKGMLDTNPENSPGKEYESLADYYRIEKGKVGKLVYMNPREYLEALLQENGGPYESVDAMIERSDALGGKYKDYERYMTNWDFDPDAGDGKFPALWIRYDSNGYSGDQEGINRAIAAMNIGVEKVPVFVEYSTQGYPDAVGRLLNGKEEVSLDTPVDAKTTSGASVRTALDEGIERVSKAAEAETPKAIVEVETPDGPVRVETPDYQFKDRSDVLITNPQPTQAALTQYHNRGMETLMKEFSNIYLPEFQNKFGDVRVSDFDWALWNTKKGLIPEQIIGTTDPTTGRMFTRNMADAIDWFGEQPFMKELRLASRKAQGMEGDFNLFGYLPHTTYDPANVSFEEALSGRGNLWQTFTGSSMMDEHNNYKGFGGDFNSRYRTFASNMLWDAKARDVAASKVIEEAQMEGMDLTPEQAIKVADGAEALQKGVDNATTTKEVVKGLTSDGDTDFDKITKNTAKDAENLGLGQSTHDNWGEVYFGKDSARVTKQRRGFVNSLDTQGNFLRNTQTTDGSMYDNGAADIVYSYGNATDVISRYMDPNDASATNLRDAIVDYYTNHGRPKKYAEIYADKAMSRLGAVPGQLTKAKAIDSLASSMKWEAWSRLRRWLVRADYSQFNTSTKKHIDQFLFNHMQMESIKNNPKISQKLAKALETITGLRYRALFYGNIKNALLQTSELNRYFSAFKWGDVAQMVKRLATDDGFRARVNTYVDIIAPKTPGLDADLYGKYSNLADSMEVEQNGVKFKDLGKKAVETADAIGLAPIEKAEAFKNRMMIAGLVQEADRLGLSGDEALRHIRKRFERVALAVDEMGRIGMSSNPLARTALFLQNFQIRELGMHLYNILDETGMAKSTPKAIINATKYITKVLGAKLATTLILARLGYSASQTLGLDPFGLLENYNQMDEDDMNWVDKQIAGGLLSPLFSGGMTSLIGDMYFMSRKAYEDSKQQTVSDEAEEKLNDTWGLAMPEGLFTWENMMEGARNFIPGNVFANRVGQMNQLLDSGWATSSTGNRMYTAPNDVLNTILGYLFGRSATQNALQYNQMYGDDLLQTIGRFNPFRQYGEFDPIDTKNYSDWFKGDGNDLQQFNKGRYWFQNERDRIIDEYQAVIEKSYASSEDISEAQNNMNRKLDELYDKLERFVAAYEKKNGQITPAMVKQILNILNTGRNIAGETAEQRNTRQQEERNKALERYSQLGLSPVGTYTGPSVNYPDTEVKYQGSPQYRAAINGYYSLPQEVVNVLKLADKELEPIRDSLQSRLSYVYSTEDWDALESIQRDYLEKFDQVVAPIIAAYGSSILSSTDVANQLNDMLSTGSNKRSGNLIPSSTYAKNKRGRYQSMPYERVDVGKWAQQRYSGDIYKQPTINSWSTVEEDLAAIRKLANEGKSARARARALELKVRVDNQERSLNKEDYNWLVEFLNKGVNK